MNRFKEKRIPNIISLTLISLIAVAIIASWIVAALSSGDEVRSLLNSEGIRWLFGSFSENMAGPLLTWLLLLAMAWGIIHESHILTDSIKPFKQSSSDSKTDSSALLSFRQKYAFRIVLAELVFFILIGLSLTVVPHAILLSVTGHLFPSTFSISFIPVLAIILIVVSATYGKLCGYLSSVSDVFGALTHGIGTAAPWIIVYMLAQELYHIIVYAF